MKKKQKTQSAKPEQKHESGSFIIRVHYIKDLSFEMPNGANAFFASGEPDIDLSYSLNNIEFDDNVFETSLVLSIAFKTANEIIYFIEIDYRGLFEFEKDIDDDTLEKALFVHCPTVLYPCARAVLLSTITAAGFAPPPLQLIDFYGLFSSSKSKD